MIEKDLNPIELYPQIFVYKNIFKDIDGFYSELKNNEGSDEGLFSEWTQWSHFGQYLSPTFKEHPFGFSLEYANDIKTETEKQDRSESLVKEHHLLCFLLLFFPLK